MKRAKGALLSAAVSGIFLGLSPLTAGAAPSPATADASIRPHDSCDSRDSGGSLRPLGSLRPIDGQEVEHPATASPMGDVADAGAKHACKGQNACKGQGGCKTDKNSCRGQNACKGQGGCRTDGKK